MGVTKILRRERERERERKVAMGFGEAVWREKAKSIGAYGISEDVWMKIKFVECV